MTRLRSPGFEALQRERERRENCLIRVRRGELPDALADYKVYVDRNIRSTPPRLAERAEVDELLIPVEPGEHSVVFREADVQRPGRKESNTLVVLLGPDQVVTFVASIAGQELRLAKCDEF